MCGFAGILTTSSLDFSNELLKMGSAIQHRGPDSQDTWVDPDSGIGMVHQRLAIVDLSAAGKQPMRSANGRFILSFNGEIYNHLLLRTQMEAVDPDIRWRGTSDTETILKAIELFGVTNAIESWVGMFAFALWDRENRSLTLGRDRFGEKPIYYGWNSGHFYFGSELKAFVATSKFRPEIDQNVLALYFRHNYVPCPYSIYKDIYKLEPGCLGTIDLVSQNVKVVKYWSATKQAQSAAKDRFDGSLTEATDEVEKLLSQSIQQQSIADVPVGAFLSGGVDSSTVVALMQKNIASKVKTFSIGFNEPEYNEAHHAKAVAAHLGTEHTELYLDTQNVLDLVPNISNIYDEPFADVSQLPTYLVSKLAREQVTVSLSGDGGDELFGGYTRYNRAAKIIGLNRKIGNKGQSILNAINSTPIMHTGPTGRMQLRLPRRYHKFASDGGRAAQLLSNRTGAEIYRDMVSHWRPPYSPGSVVNEAPYGYLDSTNWLHDQTVHEAVQMLDVLNFMPDQILVKVDRASMNCSLESRVPMLDHRLAEFVWSLPPAYHTSVDSSKPILKNLLARHVPEQITNRPKMGFAVPIGEWLRKDLRDWSESLLDQRSMDQHGYLNTKVVRNAWHDFLKGRKEIAESHIWGILVFQSWLQSQSSQ